MRFDDLDVFITLSQHKSLHSASVVLGVTQSALSKALARLETEAGTALFERSSQGVTITPTGQTVLAHARKITQAVQDLQADMGHERTAKAGLIRLATLPHLVPSFITPLLADFHRRRPMARFAIQSLLSPLLLMSLQDAQSDLVIAAHPEERHAGLSHESLGELEVCVVVREGHPRLARFKHLKDLVGERWVLPDRGIYLRHWIEQQFQREGLPPLQVTVESNHSQLAFSDLIRQSDLIGLAPLHSVQQAAQRGLVALPPQLLQAKYDLHIFWRTHGVLSPVAREFRDELLAKGAKSTL